MPSNYLQGADQSAYGASAATATQIQQASLLIDGYTQRPMGLVWSPDGNGNPAYMLAATPALTLTASGPIAIGQNVNVTVTGPLQGVTVGMALLLDRVSTSFTEVVNVTAINGSTLTLANVLFAHSGAPTLEGGMFIQERKTMPKARPLTTLTQAPVARVLAGRGRYGYSRRGSQNEYAVNEFNMLAALQRFGGPPVWETFDVSHTDVDSTTGSLWIPSGIMLAYYTDVDVTYVAGYPQAALPAEIKQACANIVAAIMNAPMNGSVQTLRAGDTQVTRFESSYIDKNTAELLAPYRVRAFA